MRLLLAMLCLLSACGDPVADDGLDPDAWEDLDDGAAVDTDPVVDDTDTDTVQGDTGDAPCTDYAIAVHGPDTPAIGDAWTVLLSCDGAVELGPYVVRITPTDLARIDENVLTFARDGAGELMVQVGSIRRRMDVTVAVR